ncbi:MAG TPA: pyridoxal-dependent decarboxylase [Euzebyales bacterium]|nr:pyridoxal-dependent decarboxylase [Euzebyales bacterium]
MPRPDPDTTTRLLDAVHTHAARYLHGLDARPVRATAASEQLRAALNGPLPDEGADPVAVVDTLARDADATMTATTSARYFGFVTGGALPAAMAADMLAAVWDQNAAMHVGGPLAATAEEVVRTWLVELLGLPADASLGLVTGGQMANTTALAVARHHLLAAVGRDVERDGLAGGPPVTVVAGAERHSTVDRGMRFVGLGGRPVPVDVDDNGAMRSGALADVLDGIEGPVIVCAQAGNVNTGALDPVGAICDVAHGHGAWVHVDGAFGLWAACSPRLRRHIAGIDRADSWAVDAHKWLNVPYDSGMVFTAHPASHTAATGTDPAQASYLAFDDEARDAMQWTPEASRRARGFAVWAALRSLGRTGVVTTVDRCCAMASRFAERLAAEPGITIHNDVVLNQVLVGFDDVDAHAVAAAVQREGTCWMGGTTWRGRRLLRISVSNWQTDTSDVDRSVEAIMAGYRAMRS